MRVVSDSVIDLIFARAFLFSNNFVLFSSGTSDWYENESCSNGQRVAEIGKMRGIRVGR